MKLVLVGGGGHCASCLDVIAATGREVEGVVDPQGLAPGGLRCLGSDEWLDSEAAAGFEFLVTLGQTRGAAVRRGLFERLRARGRRFATVVSPHALVAPGAFIGQGSIVMHRAVVNAAARVGDNCIVNTAALVEHHAVVGDHCHVATGAILNGAVRVGEGCLVGSGAIVLQGVAIAAHGIVGAGAVVSADIEHAGTWIGVPARRKE